MAASLLLCASATAQDLPAARNGESEPQSEEAPSEPSADDVVVDNAIRQRSELNLLGRTDVEGGESRRNENVQFNLVDNNALKELNIRLGATASIVMEFDAERGYFGAELGNPPSAPLHVAPGPVSEVHGSLHFTHQNSVFSARSFFQVGDVQPAHENRYGFSLGTPLWRGGSLTLSGGQRRIRGNVNGNVLVPKPDERTALATDPETRAIVQSFLDAYPTELPNRTDINERALNTNSPQRIDDDEGTIRLDQAFGDLDRISASYAFTSQQVDAFQLVAGQNPDADIKSHRARLTWSRSWTAVTATDFSAGFDRLGTLLRPEENAVGPFVSVGGALDGLGPVGSIPVDRALNGFRYAGRVQSIRGRHTLKLGFELLRRQLSGFETDVHRGFFSFGNNFGRDAITNLRLGQTTQHIVSIGDVHRGFRNWDARFFFNDDWRATPNLMLHFGLAYQPVTAPYEVNDRNTIPYSCDCNNWAPRFGFAYRLPGKWGTLRGAYGLQYGQIFPVTFQQIRFAVPGNHKIVVPDAPLVDPLKDFDGSDPNIRPTTFVLNDNLVAPYSHQYNFSWQFEPAEEWNVELGYVGSRSHKLLLMWYVNRAQPVDGIDQTSATLNIRRAVDGLADIRRILNGSIGYYDAARASLILPRVGGLTMRAVYSFSKAIDLGSSYTNTGEGSDSRLSRSQTEFDQFRDMKGRSDFDQPHSFLWNATYLTPSPVSGDGWIRKAFGDWNLSAVVVLKSGTPFGVSAGSDAPGLGNVDGNGGDRPNLLDAGVLGRTISNPDQSKLQLPGAAFGFFGLDQQSGTLGRNTFRKASIRNLNAAVARTWVAFAETRLTFRAEAINLSNTPQFASPGAALANPNFGEITNTLNDGRTFQFSLRLDF